MRWPQIVAADGAQRAMVEETFRRVYKEDLVAVSELKPGCTDRES